MRYSHESIIRLVALASALIFATVIAHASRAADLVIRDVSIISPERGTPLHNATVAIRDGRIASINNGLVDTNTTTNIVNGTGLYLIPGLTDSHVHTPVIPGMGFRGEPAVENNSELAAPYENQQARSLLYFGVTQIVDPATHPGGVSYTQFTAQEIRPEMYHCGAAPLANGYPTVLMHPRVIASALPYRIYENDETARASGADPVLHTPEAVVQRMHGDGAICVKLFFEDGWGPLTHWPMLSKDSSDRVIREARRLGMSVMGHANAIDMQIQAVEAGVDVLAHGLWNWNQYGELPDVPDGISTHLDTVIERGIAYQPTMRVIDSIHDMFVPTAMNNPKLKKSVPKKLLDWYRTPAAHSFKKELVKDDFDNLPEDRIEKMIVNGPRSRGERSLRYLANNGHQQLLFASDHPGTPAHTNHPGLSSYQELVHMAEIGVPLRTIFESATINNAKTFGLTQHFGTIEVDKSANLLLLKSNPLESIDAYDSIKWIVLNGTLIERESLAAN